MASEGWMAAESRTAAESRMIQLKREIQHAGKGTANQLPGDSPLLVAPLRHTGTDTRLIAELSAQLHESQAESRVLSKEVAALKEQIVQLQTQHTTQQQLVHQTLQSMQEQLQQHHDHLQHFHQLQSGPGNGRSPSANGHAAHEHTVVVGAVPAAHPRLAACSQAQAVPCHAMHMQPRAQLHYSASQMSVPLSSMSQPTPGLMASLTSPNTSPLISAEPRVEERTRSGRTGGSGGSSQVASHCASPWQQLAHDPATAALPRWGVQMRAPQNRLMAPPHNPSSSTCPPLPVFVGGLGGTDEGCSYGGSAWGAEPSPAPGTGTDGTASGMSRPISSNLDLLAKLSMSSPPLEHRTVVGLPPLPAVEAGSTSPMGAKRMRDERGSTQAETLRALALKDHASTSESSLCSESSADDPIASGLPTVPEDFDEPKPTSARTMPEPEDQLRDVVLPTAEVAHPHAQARPVRSPCSLPLPYARSNNPVPSAFSLPNGAPS